MNNIKIFSCYQNNISSKIVDYQRKIFDLFNIDLIQEYTKLNHSDYLDFKINNTEFDIIIFFDIDCIPLKPNIVEYILEQLADNNSIIGVEQANQTIGSDFVFAGPPCFGIKKDVFLKLGKPSFGYTNRGDTGAEFTHISREMGINVKLFNITSSQNKKWKCGKKRFGNGTIYDDLLYHQFESRKYSESLEHSLNEYRFVIKCKEILEKYGNI